MPATKVVGSLRNEALVGAADAELGYTAPEALSWPRATAPAARDLRDSAADLVLSTNGLTR
ncbi:MAG: hypothetical protein M3273_07940 [Actinomycetota bacterium]|nr:hypothetical protein [Actinomycetota bacterium]